MSRLRFSFTFRVGPPPGGPRVDILISNTRLTDAYRDAERLAQTNISRAQGYAPELEAAFEILGTTWVPLPVAGVLAAVGQVIGGASPSPVCPVIGGPHAGEWWPDGAVHGEVRAGYEFRRFSTSGISCPFHWAWPSAHPTVRDVEAAWVKRPKSDTPGPAAPETPPPKPCGCGAKPVNHVPGGLHCRL